MSSANANASTSPQALGPPSPYTIPFRNDSGEEIPAYAVMYPNEVIVSDGEWMYSVKKPGFESKFARVWLINGPAKVPTGGDGMASDGSTPCLVKREDATDEDDFGKGWGAKNDSWELRPHGAGDFEFLKNSALPSGTTDKRGLFRQGTCNTLLVELSAALDAGLSATANIFGGDPPGDTDLGFDLPEVWDQRLDNQYLENGAKCIVGWIAGEWYIVDSPCPVDGDPPA